MERSRIFQWILMTTTKNSFWFWHFMMQNLFLHKFHTASTDWSGVVPSLDVKLLLSGPNVLGCTKLLASVGRVDEECETLGLSSFVTVRGVTNGLYMCVCFSMSSSERLVVLLDSLVPLLSHLWGWALPAHTDLHQPGSIQRGGHLHRAAHRGGPLQHTPLPR